jgi:hypothetical protein
MRVCHGVDDERHQHGHAARPSTWSRCWARCPGERIATCDAEASHALGIGAVQAAQHERALLGFGFSRHCSSMSSTTKHEIRIAAGHRSGFALLLPSESSSLLTMSSRGCRNLVRGGVVARMAAVTLTTCGAGSTTSDTSTDTLRGQAHEHDDRHVARTSASPHAMPKLIMLRKARTSSSLRAMPKLIMSRKARSFK